MKQKRGRGRPRKENVAEGSNTDKSRIYRDGLKEERKRAENRTRRLEKLLLWEIDREGIAATIRSASTPVTIEVRAGEPPDRAWYRAVRRIFLWSKLREFFATHPTRRSK
jgi:hypothetical protein